MVEDRETLRYLSRTLGTHTGWDGDLGECFWFYDFQPTPGIELPACDTFRIDETNGNFDALDAKGDILATFDVIRVLSNIPKD